MASHLGGKQRHAVENSSFSLSILNQTGLHMTFYVNTESEGITGGSDLLLNILRLIKNLKDVS